jgi:uncharacterized membrane protein (UPF0127 family)
MARITIVNVTKQTILGDAIDVADTSATRVKGLLGRDGLEPGEGLWIVPCEAIHTFRMRFPIDIVFVSRKKQVTKVVSGLKPSRMALSWRARSVVELPAGRAAATRTEPGDQIEIRRHDGEE